MAETYYSMQVNLPMDSGLAQDAVTNTWHYTKIGGTEATAADEMADRLQSFYGSLSGVLSAQINETLVRFKAYDLEDAEPRVPVFDEFRSITAPSAGASLPHEVTCVGSYHGTFTSGVNPASRRGRAFLGPLKVSSIEDASSRVQFTAAARTVFFNAFDVMLTGFEGSLLVKWITYSPTIRASQGIASAVSIVTGGFIDNEPDTQRRRGQISNNRSVF